MDIANDEPIADDEELLAELHALMGEGGAKTKCIGVQEVYASGDVFNESENECEIDNDEQLLNELNQLMEQSIEVKVNPGKKGSLIPEFEETHKPKSELSKKPMNANNWSPTTMEITCDTVELEPVPADPLISNTTHNSYDILSSVPSEASSNIMKENETTSQIVVEKSFMEKTDRILENRAKELLHRRRKLYMDRALAAKRVNDKKTAIEAFETVKLFNQALDAIKEGAQLSEEDIDQIPPSPLPYQEIRKEECKINQSDQLQHQIGTDSNQPGPLLIRNSEHFETSIEGQDDRAKNAVSTELALVTQRQLELKKEAIAAKQRGDLKAAKDYLTLAHRMDQMVEAARCGLPININQIPQIHSNTKTIPEIVDKIPLSNAEIRKCKILETELIKQIGLCENNVKKFQSANDTKNTLLFSGLLQQSKEDLQQVQLAALGKRELPSFKLLELNLPVVDFYNSISDDKMELHIRKIENLKLPESMKSSDLCLYVFYIFPFPHGTKQTGRTATLKGTNSPEFNDVFHLDINRKTKQLLRICKRQSLKLEVYQKGGFLRSDKLIGHSDVPLQQLEKSVSISGVFPILEGRKKTGGNIQAEIRISKPMGEQTHTTAATKRKWIKLDN